MKHFTVLSCCLLVSFAQCTEAAPRPQLFDAVKTIAQSVIRVISSQSENYGPEGYKFTYELDDGTVRAEEGKFVNGVWTVSGQSSYVSPEDTQINTNFVADDKGFNPEIKIQPRLLASSVGSLVGGG